MIWVAWRQFRTQLLVTLGRTRGVRRTRDRDRRASARHLQLLPRPARLCTAERSHRGALWPPRARAAGDAGPARDALGRPTGGARVRERGAPPRVDAKHHAPAVAGGQGRDGRCRRARRRRRCELARQLGARAGRRHQDEPLRPEHVLRPRDRRDRLRRVRVCFRRYGRHADPAHAAGHDHDADRIRRSAARVHAMGATAPAREQADRRIRGAGARASGSSAAPLA